MCSVRASYQFSNWVTVLFTYLKGSANTHILGSVSHSGRKTSEAKTSDQQGPTAPIYFWDFQIEDETKYSAHADTKMLVKFWLQLWHSGSIFWPRKKLKETSCTSFEQRSHSQDILVIKAHLVLTLPSEVLRCVLSLGPDLYAAAWHTTLTTFNHLVKNTSALKDSLHILHPVLERLQTDGLSPEERLSVYLCVYRIE